MNKQRKKSKKKAGKSSSPAKSANTESKPDLQPAPEKPGNKSPAAFDSAGSVVSEPRKETAPTAPSPQHPAAADPETDSFRVRQEPKPPRMDPDKNAPRQEQNRVEEYREVPLNQLSKQALSVSLDPKLDKQSPRWLKKTMDHVIHYMAVPKKKTLREKIWHHRLRVPVLYALAGITVALVASLYDAHRIYRMQGDLDYTPPQIDRPPLTVDEEGETLVIVREKYNQEVYRIENKKNILQQEWPNAYIAKLQQMQDALRDKGDFMAWMDVKRELERFNAEQTILERHIVKSPEELRALQIAYHEVDSRYEADMQAALSERHGHTLRQLEALLKTKKAQGAQEETLRAIAVEIEHMRNNAPAAPVREPDPDA